MVNPTPQFNLSLEEAIAVLDEQVEKNVRQTEDGVQTRQLDGMSLDQAYDVGYATLLHDLKSLTGPDPMEVYVVRVTKSGVDEAFGPASPDALTNKENHDD